MARRYRIHEKGCAEQRCDVTCAKSSGKSREGVTIEIDVMKPSGTVRPCNRGDSSSPVFMVHRVGSPPSPTHPDMCRLQNDEALLFVARLPKFEEC